MSTINIFESKLSRLGFLHGKEYHFYPLLAYEKQYIRDDPISLCWFSSPSQCKANTSENICQHSPYFTLLTIDHCKSGSGSCKG